MKRPKAAEMASIPVSAIAEKQPGTQPHADNDQRNHQHCIKQPIHVAPICPKYGNSSPEAVGKY
jgi:hypothetical protein